MRRSSVVSLPLQLVFPGHNIVTAVTYFITAINYILITFKGPFHINFTDVINSLLLTLVGLLLAA
jgi:hypothetical protein